MIIIGIIISFEKSKDGENAVSFFLIISLGVRISSCSRCTLIIGILVGKLLVYCRKTAFILIAWNHCRLAWSWYLINLWFTIIIIVGLKLAPILILELHNMSILWISLNFNYWVTWIFIFSNDLFIYSIFFTLIIRILRLGLIVMQINVMVILTSNRFFCVLFCLLLFFLRFVNSCIQINFANLRFSAQT